MSSGVPSGKGAAAEHCVYAFDVLVSHFSGSETPPPAFAVDEEYPLFVTWDKRDRSGNMNLRGCIGTLSAQPISAIKDYALSSAFNDRRFPAMKESELPLLECSVSLLTNFEKARAWDDWVVGTHGVWIDFTDPAGVARNATYLPNVPPEQGWQVEETINSLIRKAGYQGPIDARVRSSIVLTRYQSTKSSLTYDEYVSIASRRS
eukprot:CAMPEP_0206053060 /NCGR_PEP_ID=MMETSP1466-20131121/35007_1 /ASSEMBLY_ACC=CAM_ASM_001126 /TAXON_ID=44452 /ORGANISM="Pavlova gyrans, Strain CCMP608" /LENGTH=204 /DNA_ID=CAMNT_0053428219 /DNA_START=23 /DNA_END=637 /DNA_ORIENTATION=+